MHKMLLRNDEEDSWKLRQVISAVTCFYQCLELKKRDRLCIPQSPQFSQGHSKTISLDLSGIYSQIICSCASRLLQCLSWKISYWPAPNWKESFKAMSNLRTRKTWTPSLIGFALSTNLQTLMWLRNIIIDDSQRSWIESNIFSDWYQVGHMFRL